jgi:imidazolonepropionase-like amidohydrolase
MKALIGGTIHSSPADEPIRGGVVLIDGDRIASAGIEAPPPDATIIDCTGLIITAGFWNSHVHFFERKWADAANIPAEELAAQLRDTFTRYGFTSVFDLSSPWANTRRIRERIESGEVAGPRIRSTGEGLVPPGAVPSEQVLHAMGVMNTPLPEITDAARAGAAARTLLDAGVDGIKLFASTPRGVPLPAGSLEAAVDEAHRAGKPVFVHPNSAADVVAALRAGVDVIAHTTPRSGAWDMAPNGAALTPTLNLWKFFLRHDRASVQTQMVDAAVEQLRAWIGAGGTVLFGTDLGAVDADPSEEYALMAAAGMSFREILASLTTAPAARFGGSGRIAAGHPADVVVFDRDLANVRYTLRGGEIVFRQESSAQVPSC